MVVAYVILVKFNLILYPPFQIGYFLSVLYNNTVSS